MNVFRFITRASVIAVFFGALALAQDEAVPTPEVPVTETPAPDAPVAETPAPAVPVEEMPAPETAPVPDPAPAPEAMPAPEPAPAPETAPAPEAMPAPETAPAPEPAPAPETTPAPEPAPAPEAMPAPEPVAEIPQVDTGIKLATFVIDITPPLGTPLCLGGVAPAAKIIDPLTVRGFILLVKDKKPMVMVAVDWVGIANDAHLAWRAAIAEAVGTDAHNVAVHCLHQHDAPGADFGVEALLEQQGLGGKMFNVAYAHETLNRVTEAAHHSMEKAQTITHFGTGSAKVEMVASNRRILNEEGKVAAMRFTSCPDPELRAAPEGTIDPTLRCLSFWNGETPVAVLTFYATHPQSDYGKGGVTWDYPGLARAARERAIPEAAHIHFTGAGGNIGAGKYNDGSTENRLFLAGRVALAMRQAWEGTVKQALEPKDIEWRTEDVLLPTRPELSIQTENDALLDENNSEARRMAAARELFWLQRSAAQEPVTLTALRVANAYVLGMPGELFVEYQLSAQAMLPENFVAMAAYADYGPGYICTAKAYAEGGYESEVYTSRTAPEVEAVLTAAMGKLLGK